MAAALLALAVGAGAQGRAEPGTSPKLPTAGNTDWKRLSPTQQQALAPLQPQWKDIDPARRAKWLEVASRFPTMTADERSRLQERMSEWSRMSPSERSQARLSFTQAKQLPTQERQARWEAYRALEPQERAALARSGAASAAAGTRALPGAGAAAAPASVKPVAPTVIQVKPGATTTLMNTQPKPLTHRSPDAPRIAANSNTVDSATLLPKRGPQGAPLRASAASAAEPARP